MTILVLMLDVSLGLFLITIAWQSLVSPSLYRATVLFMVFGLVMAMAWARLGAPDIALAEAAIGAGLTGALLLSTLEVVRPRTVNGARRDSETES